MSIRMRSHRGGAPWTAPALAMFLAALAWFGPAVAQTSPAPATAPAISTPPQVQPQPLAEPQAEVPEAVEPEPAPIAETPVAPVAKPVPVKRAARELSVGKGKAAFTLRLDPDRHLRLRLASAVSHRSAQQLVCEALDRFLESLPEVEAMASRLPARDDRR